MVIVRSIFVVRTQRISCDVRNFVCQRKMVVFTAFFPNKHRKLCFVIKVLNKKKQYYYPAQYPAQYQAIFHMILQDNCLIEGL